MCSSFTWKRMESDQGDLGDIVRAGSCGGMASSANHPMIAADWQFPKPMSFPPSMEGPAEDFGEPFPNFRDPLLHELAGTMFFDRPDSASGLMKMSLDSHDGDVNSNDGGGLLAQKILGEEMRRPCNIFSRVLQISPPVKVPPISPRGIRPSPVLGTDMLKLNNCSASCLVDHGGTQISSPRAPGIKRRKSQAKKVVCIPAPAAASSRPSGEVVPSDLWAWRKYGQKPIKGSPYPRGYYRCSSSKGCSARKQVERSRTDPNMLVITYTSEHNHPWPTQRNALAGSTRAQPAKNNSSVSKNSHHSEQHPAITVKEEERETASMSTAVKEEFPEIEKPIDASDDTDFDQVLCHGYKASFPESNHPDDFFAELGDIDPDPMNLVFPKGFLGDKSDEERENKALDPFSIFDWAGNSFGETRSRGL